MTLTKHFISKILFLGIVTMCCPGSARSQQTDLEKPNIIWINCEDIGPALGAYGDTFATTPNLDQMAKEGILFKKAYATAPICSPSRSALITGMYATSLGTQHLRSNIKRPDFIKTLPELLKKEGYFTSNYGKTDYNFDPDGIYDYRQNDLFPWRKRKKGQPFFSYYVFGMTHEGSVNHTVKWKENTKDLDASLFHDSAKVSVPIYHPNSPAFKNIWTHYYDNNTVFDKIVGQILGALETEGLKENTIVFFFSDHGPGLPRYKRWLYNTGLHVPFIAYLPEKYRTKYGLRQGVENNDLVSFVDFVPTILNLAELPIPDTVEGMPFLGRNLPEARTHVIGARSRADNMYEKSRAVVEGKFIYIRNYMPHLPYIQPGYIFSGVKESFADLHRRRAAGALPAEAERMFGTKAPEELYDLENDPNELENLAYLPEYENQAQKMRKQLHSWILGSKDTGFLPETEYMIRSKNSTPYQMAHDPEQYDLPKILNAAELAGTGDQNAIEKAMKDADNGVRYWGLIASKATKLPKKSFLAQWRTLLDDSSPSVQIMAAEYLLHEEENGKALNVLGKWVQDDRGYLALQAARSIELVGEKASPLVPVLKKVLDDKMGDNGTRFPYKDFMFSAFTAWSVKWALYHCGEEVDISK